VYHLVLFLRMRLANQPTITGVAFCHISSSARELGSGQVFPTEALP